MSVNSPKYRDYFITINEGAECYEEAQEIIVSQTNYKLYALIKHDKDILKEVDEDGNVKEKPKKTHKHIVLELKNPVSFESMKKKFKGAHIESPKYKKSAYQYLIHNRPNARDKYQYAITDIISNDINAVKFSIESETFELFKENMFVTYIAEGTRTSYQFAKRFGLNAYKQYWKAYSDMLTEYQSDEELRQDVEDAKMRLFEQELPF